MQWAVCIHHPPTGYAGPHVKLHVSGRVQRLFFRWWDLRMLLACWRSARSLYGAERVHIERW